MRRGVLVLPAIAVLLGATGCTSSRPDSGYCVPLVRVTPRHVHPGDQVTVVVDKGCDVKAPAAGWAITAAPDGRPESAVTTRVDAELKDGFRAAVTLPASFPVGDASASIAHWSFAKCDDGGGSCAAPSGDFSVAALP